MEPTPRIIANDVSKECRELLKEIVRQQGKIVDLVTTNIIYIPNEKADG